MTTLSSTISPTSSAPPQQHYHVCSHGSDLCHSSNGKGAQNTPKTHTCASTTNPKSESLVRPRPASMVPPFTVTATLTVTMTATMTDSDSDSDSAQQLSNVAPARADVLFHHDE
eukprot:786657-Prorocentrum_minimum.AAC.1